MLNFQECGDFPDYFGPRWNYYLKDAIAWIPMPFKFVKGEFETGVAGQMLAHYAAKPEAFLDERGKEKLGDVSRSLWRQFNETMEESGGAELGAATSAESLGDQQNELLENSNEPF